MAELTYDISISGMRLTVKCRERILKVVAPVGKGDSEYLDIALEAIKAEGREVVEVIVTRTGMASKSYQVRTKSVSAPIS